MIIEITETNFSPTSKLLREAFAFLIHALQFLKTRKNKSSQWGLKVSINNGKRILLPIDTYQILPNSLIGVNSYRSYTLNQLFNLVRKLNPLISINSIYKVKIVLIYSAMRIRQIAVTWILVFSLKPTFLRAKKMIYTTTVLVIAIIKIIRKSTPY